MIAALFKRKTKPAFVMDTGDEVVSCLGALARERQLHAAQITAIGAVRRAVLGYFDMQARQYRRLEFDGQMEVLSLIADIAMEGDLPRLHAHAVLGCADASTRGGHLLEAEVRPTLEVIITESPAYLVRRHDPQTGLALIRF